MGDRGGRQGGGRRRRRRGGGGGGEGAAYVGGLTPALCSMTPLHDHFKQFGEVRESAGPASGFGLAWGWGWGQGRGQG